MSFKPLYYAGVHFSSGSRLTWCVLAPNLRVTALTEGSFDEAVKTLTQLTPLLVGINAPQSLAQQASQPSLLPEKIETTLKRRGRPAHALQRMADRELRRRGVNHSAAAPVIDACPPWMRSGLLFYQTLIEMGWQPFPHPEAHGQWAEVNADASFHAVLNTTPLNPRTLEGRLQRQAVLYEERLDIINPMAFFEEITRHRLLMGHLPEDKTYSQPQLNALSAAWTVWLAVQRPQRSTWLGIPAEGQILTPTWKEDGQTPD